MKVPTPWILREAMDERAVYDSLKNSGYILGMPGYDYGAKKLPEQAKEGIKRLPRGVQMDIIWNVLVSAHDKLRSRSDILRLFYSEDCGNSLNAFMPLELAGADVFVIWARQFQRLFGKAGFSLDYTPKMPDSYKTSLTWMDEVDYTLPPMLKTIFVENRRRFAEGHKLVGKRELYDYVTSTGSDVLGVCDWQKDNDSDLYTLKVRIQRDLYTDEYSSLPFRLVRQIILANNGDDPINW